MTAKHLPLVEPSTGFHERSESLGTCTTAAASSASSRGSRPPTTANARLPSLSASSQGIAGSDLKLLRVKNDKRSRSLQPTESCGTHSQMQPQKRRKSSLSSKKTSANRFPTANTAPKLVSKRRDSLNEGITMHCEDMQHLQAHEVIDNKYDILRCLGQGNFAVVSECIDRQTQKHFALKEIELPLVNGKEYLLENEAHIMFKNKHRTICGIEAAYRTEYAYYLVLELAPNGDLFDCIKREGLLPPHIVARIIADAAAALRFLHKREIVHRDVKPENLLLSHDYHVKLTDFGLACRVDGPLYRVCGTPTYVAPEVLSETGYGCAIDVWSLGVIMHILLCGYAPFRSAQRDRLFMLIRQGALSFREPIWGTVPAGARRLLVRMLQVDSDKRATARRVCGNKWLKTTIADEEAEAQEALKERRASNANVPLEADGAQTVPQSSFHTDDNSLPQEEL